MVEDAAVHENNRNDELNQQPNDYIDSLGAFE